MLSVLRAPLLKFSTRLVRRKRRSETTVLWVLGSEDEDRRRPGDTSVLTRSGQWAPTVFVDQVQEGRLELWALLSCTARRLGFGNHVYVREYDRCKGAKE